MVASLGGQSEREGAEYWARREVQEAGNPQGHPRPVIVVPLIRCAVPLHHLLGCGTCGNDGDGDVTVRHNEVGDAADQRADYAGGSS